MDSDRRRKRFERQVSALIRALPKSRFLLESGSGDLGRVLRLFAATVLIAGGLLAFLPGFGLWMIPIGLVMLAVDIPVLRPVVASMVIRMRRLYAKWRRQFLRGRQRRKATPGKSKDI